MCDADGAVRISGSGCHMLVQPTCSTSSQRSHVAADGSTHGSAHGSTLDSTPRAPPGPLVCTMVCTDYSAVVESLQLDSRFGLGSTNPLSLPFHPGDRRRIRPWTSGHSGAAATRQAWGWGRGWRPAPTSWTRTRLRLVA